MRSLAGLSPDLDEPHLLRRAAEPGSIQTAQVRIELHPYALAVAAVFGLSIESFGKGTGRTESHLAEQRNDEVAVL